MKRRLCLLLALSITLLGYVSVPSILPYLTGAIEPTPSNARRMRFVACIGDSIAAGVSTTGSWCPRLQGQLSGQRFAVANHAVGGETCSQMVPRVQAYVVGKGYTGLIIACGTNDCAGSRTPSSIKADIQTMAQDGVTGGLAVTVTTIAPRKNDPAYTSGLQACMDDVNTWIVNTLPSLVPGVDAVDVRPALWDAGDHLALNPTYVTNNDWLHYNDVGHSAHAAALVAANPLALSTPTP